MGAVVGADVRLSDGFGEGELVGFDGAEVGVTAGLVDGSDRGEFVG